MFRFTRFFFISIFILQLQLSFADNFFKKSSIISKDSTYNIDSLSINYVRLGIVCAGSASTLGASYIYMKYAWWSDISTKFHLDKGRDLKYAVNIDKVAHFYGGIIYSDIFANSLIWANVPPKKAIWYGAGLGVFVHSMIEIKDGYAPRWGFSICDLAFGSLGSFYKVGQYYNSVLKDIDIKFSYFIRTKKYFEFNKNGHWIDDYINQTYWATFNINYYLPDKIEKHWPDFLSITTGIGVDDELDGQGAGRIELYVGLDYDLKMVLKKYNSPFWKLIKNYLNYIKLPAPTIRITPKVTPHILYF